MSSETKSIRVIAFSGKAKDYRMWARKFMSLASIKGYKKIMTGKETPLGHLIDCADTKEGKAQEEARKQNERGYSELLLSVSDEVTFGLIDGSRTTDLPEGCLMTAWNKLERKFVPKTNATMVKLVKEFGQMSLKDKKKDPDEWITELEYVRARLTAVGKMKDDKDVMIHILNNLPVEYENTVETLERRLDDTLDPLSIEIIREELSLKYEKIKRALGLDDDDASEKEETALLSGGFQKFKERCYGCGKFGHKSQLCPDKDKDGNAARKNSVPPGTVCNYCKKEGHWKREFPELAKKK